MTEVTINLPDKLAARIGVAGNVWLPTIIELSMIGFRASATARASAEIVNFLSANPSPQEVSGFYISDELQERLDYLLDMNREGEIEESEQYELDEWMKFDHITIMLKAQAADGSVVILWKKLKEKDAPFWRSQG